MSERGKEEGLAIRRILVALDASRHSLAALRAAVELADSLEAELRGLFVEDIELLRMAGLPGMREVRYPFNATARLDRARMERQLRAQAERARQALVRACERKGVRWSFRVARGDVAAEVLEAAVEADLLSLGKASRPLTLRTRMGSTARAAAEQTSRSLLLLPDDADIRPPVVAFQDESSSARQALLMAAHLAQRWGKCLSVLTLAETPEALERMKDRAAEWLRGQGLIVRYRQLPSADVAILAQVAREEGSGVLVLSGANLQPEQIQMVLDGVECPLLVVR